MRMTIARKKSFVQFLFVWLVGSAIVWLGFCFLYGFFKAPKLTVVFVWLPIFSAFWPVWIWFVVAIMEYFAKKAKI